MVHYKRTRKAHHIVLVAPMSVKAIIELDMTQQCSTSYIKKKETNK